MQRKTLYYLIIALGILAAGWSVYCWNTTWRNIETNVPPTVSTPNATTQPNSQGTTTIEVITPKAKVSTEGWKTYRNGEYGYEFRYPSDWVVYNSLDDSGPSIQGTDLGYHPYTDSMIGGVKTSISSCKLLITLTHTLTKDLAPSQKNKLTATTTAEEFYSGRSWIGEYLLDGKIVVTTFRNSYGYMENECGFSYAVGFVHDGRVFQMVAHIIPFPLFETILSTFKFLDK